MRSREELRKRRDDSGSSEFRSPRGVYQPSEIGRDGMEPSSISDPGSAFVHALMIQLSYGRSAGNMAIGTRLAKVLNPR